MVQVSPVDQPTAAGGLLLQHSRPCPAGLKHKTPWEPLGVPHYHLFKSNLKSRLWDESSSCPDPCAAET